MKHNPLTILILISFVAVSSAADYLLPTPTGPIEDEIAKLSTLIIPPPGTAKADVDSVFGEPKELKEPPKIKASKADYPMHIYVLLPSPQGEASRATLYITYQEGKVWRVGVNHLCVTKNREGIFPGSPVEQRQRQEIAAERPFVLNDLREIRDRFDEKLKGASWNKKTSKPVSPANESQPIRIQTNSTPPKST